MRQILPKWPKYSFTLLCTLLILLVCLMDFSDISPDDLPLPQGFDKVVHAAMYFCLGAVFIWEYRRRPRWEQLRGDTSRLKPLFWWVLILSVVVGGGIEYLQGLTDYRSRDAQDLTADIVGALFAFLAYCLLAFSHPDDPSRPMDATGRP